MFDNLFGFAGPLGTALVLVLVLAGAAVFTLSGSMKQIANGRVRV